MIASILTTVFPVVFVTISVAVAVSVASDANGIPSSKTYSSGFNKGPEQIGIVELHDHILVHLLLARRSGLLPNLLLDNKNANANNNNGNGGGGITLLSFDSHGDMQLPKQFFDNKLDKFNDDPQTILKFTQISDWVPAAMWLGLISRVVFVEPPWGIEFVSRPPHYSLLLTIGKQINKEDFGVNVKSVVTGEDLTRTFARVIGCDVFSGNGRGVLDPEKDLEPDSILTIEFEVVKLEDFPIRVPQLLANDNNPMVLSIDMDVVSTESPRHLMVKQQMNLPLRVQQSLFELWRNITVPMDFMFWKKTFTDNSLTASDDDDYYVCPALLNNLTVQEIEAHEKEVKDSEGGSSDDEEDDWKLSSANSVLKPIHLNTNKKRKTSEDSDVSQQDMSPHQVVKTLVNQMQSIESIYPNMPPPNRELAIQLLEPYAENSIIPALQRLGGIQPIMHMLHEIIFFPVHISSEAATTLIINQIECTLEHILDTFDKAPVLINLARSPTFLPIHQTSHVECSFLRKLKQMYPSIDHLDYDGAVALNVTSCEEHHSLFSNHNINYDSYFGGVGGGNTRIDGADLNSNNAIIEGVCLEKDMVDKEIQNSGRYLGTSTLTELVISNLSGYDMLLKAMPSVNIGTEQGTDGAGKVIGFIGPNRQESFPINLQYDLIFTVLARNQNTGAVITLVKDKRLNPSLGHTIFWSFSSAEIKRALDADSVY